MQKARHDKTHKRAPGSWLSTAESTMQSARLTKQLFSPRADQSADSSDRMAENFGDKIVENFQEALEQIFRDDDRHEASAAPDLSATARDTAFNRNAARAPDRTARHHVVLFAPGPITQAELHRENLKRAAVIRQKYRRRKRFGWLNDNAGTIAAVAILLILAWFMAAR
jgi:hypothetical protein